MRKVDDKRFSGEEREGDNYQDQTILTGDFRRKFSK